MDGWIEQHPPDHHRPPGRTNQRRWRGNVGAPAGWNGTLHVLGGADDETFALLSTSVEQQLTVFPSRCNQPWKTNL